MSDPTKLRDQCRPFGPSGSRKKLAWGPKRWAVFGGQP